MSPVPTIHITSLGDPLPSLAMFVSRGDHIAVHVSLPDGSTECYMVGRKGVERAEIAASKFGCGCP